MPVFPVTDTPHFVSGIFSRPYLVRNAGAETVYLGQDSSLAVGSQAISMNPGGTLNWSGETELWALSDPGKTSTLELLYTGDSAFTPGPDVVTAAQAGEEVFNQTLNIPAGALAFDILGGIPLDLSRFATILVSIKAQFPGLGSADLVNFDEYVFHWGATNVNARDTFGNSETGWVTMALSVKHPTLATILVSNTFAAARSYNIQIVGLTAAYPEWYNHRWEVLNPATGWSGPVFSNPLTGFVANGATIVHNGTGFYAMNHYSGKIARTWMRKQINGGTAANSLTALMAFGFPYLLLDTDEPPAATPIERQFSELYFPRYPTWLRQTATGTVGNIFTLDLQLVFEGVNSER